MFQVQLLSELFNNFSSIIHNVWFFGFSSVVYHNPHSIHPKQSYCIYIADEKKKNNVWFFGFQGAMTHQDFAGHKGTIGTGDVQVKSIIIAVAICYYLLKNQKTS